MNLNQFELELTKHICSGKSSSEIGALMFRSPRTIEEHREKLYKKLGVSKKEDSSLRLLRCKSYSPKSKYRKFTG
ncbi:MAG: helix-turn-helix transcriptional regulator [Chryseotalea sp.]|jgi:DNA-binding CsgD family transcriptional regulator